jgi:transcriptional regulator with XRE-family HTH domain
MIEFDFTNYQGNITKCVFAERFDRIMTVRDVQNQELARAIFVAPTTVSGWRNGWRMPDLQNLFFICCALQISSDYLLGINDDASVITPSIPSVSEEAGGI